MTWFNRLRNWQTDESNAIGVEADNHDEEDDNFAAGINQCINIAGLNSPTADIPWGSNKITGLASGAASTDACTIGQAQTRTISYAIDTGGVDAFAIAPSPAITAYAAGQQFTFQPANANTGACTINVNSLGAKSIKKDYNADPAAGDLVANQMITIVYDGTNFQMLNAAHGLLSQSLSQIYAADAGSNDTYVINPSPAFSAYSAGMMLNFYANTANTGAATLNVNSLGAVAIRKAGGAVLSDNDIAAGQIVQVIYDGTYFIMISPVFGAVGQNGSSIYAADGEASDDYVITLSPVPGSLITGAVYRFKANTANTGAATLNVNSLGATAIKKFGSTNDVATGDIRAGQIVSVVYDGTNFQMLSCVDDIANLTQDSTPDTATDFVKTWDASAATYKKVLLEDVYSTPTGSIVQVQSATLTSTASSSVRAFADTGLTVSITPTSASNTIVIMAMIHTSNNNGTTNNSTYLSLLRDSTQILLGDSSGSKTQTTSSIAPSGSLSMDAVTIVYEDSPSTTSATTYKVQFGASNDAGTVYINRSYSDTDVVSVGRSASSIIVMEVKG